MKTTHATIPTPTPTGHPMTDDTHISDEERELFRQAIDNIDPRGYDAPRPLTPEKQRAQGTDQEPYLSNAELLLNNIPDDQWVGRDCTLHFSRTGVNHRQLNRLKMGKVRPQMRIDLHGMSAIDAQSMAHSCLEQAKIEGLQCVLIIHGKGSYNPNDPPKIKNLLNQWLPSREDVVAFHQSCPRDGGSGALYVLLSNKS